MRRSIPPVILFLALQLLMLSGFAQQTKYTDVLIIGGGTAGTAAAIQSGQMGISTMIVEPTTWLGGMISAAGVSAFDGNHHMPSGIWAEFREKIHQVYGGEAKVATGWVSNTLFEPHVADSILKKMVTAIPAISVMYRHVLKDVLVKQGKVWGAVVEDLVTGQRTTIHSKQLIDATELGDAIAMAKIPFDVGMESGAVTGEKVGVTETNDIIQDLTYTAILKDYGPAIDCTMQRPANYDPSVFDCSTNKYCGTKNTLYSNVTPAKMLDYGRLPNGKYMINWPSNGNDFYLNVIPLDYSKREQALELAKQHTLNFVYYVQTILGYKNLALANDEFPTADRLPLIAYHREGRRMRGVIRFTMNDIADPFANENGLYRTGVSVGDYPIDHHHRKNPKAPQHLSFYPVPSFNIPMGTLIPRTMDGIIAAEKCISVSNVANGTTRLQPVVMLTGQAAGVLAALCIKEGKQARQINVRQVQAALLNAKAYIMPYYDVPPSDPAFISIQRIGATGILKGRGEPYQWANRTWFYPDSLVDAGSFKQDAAPFVKNLLFSGKYLTIRDACMVADKMMMRFNRPAVNTGALKEAARQWTTWGLTSWDPGRQISRRELAILLDKYVQLFTNAKVDIKGNLLN